MLKRLSFFPVEPSALPVLSPVLSDDSSLICTPVLRNPGSLADGGSPSPAALWARLQGQTSIGSSESSPGAVRVVEPVRGEVRRSRASVSRGVGLFDQVQQFGLAGDAE